jgi:hypothetical protein
MKKPVKAKAKTKAKAKAKSKSKATTYTMYYKPSIPTKDDITSEIALLTQMKPNVRESSIFGDNHHDAIDAQIEILAGRTRKSDINDLRDNEDWTDHVADSAQEAADWMMGYTKDKPSDEWKELLVK